MWVNEFPKMNLTEDTRSGHGSVARNVFYLMLGQVGTTTLAIFLSAALGRNLGARDFGLYFLISSFSTFAYVLADWGQQHYIIREIARRPERGSLLLGTILTLRTAGAILVAVPSGIAAWVLGYDAITCWYTVAFVAVTFPSFLAQSYGLVFRGRDRMDLDARVSVVNKFALLAFALAALLLNGRILGVLIAQALAGLLAFAIATRYYRRLNSGPLRFSPEIAREVVVYGSAFFISIALANIQPYIDVVILSKFAPPDVVGWYGAAKNILSTILAPALILGAAAYPRLARSAANRGPFSEDVRAAMRPILWFGALAATGTFLFGDNAVAIIYGKVDFAPAGIILKVYAPGFFLVFIDVLLGYSLFAIDRVFAMAWAKAASLVVSTALELVLVPMFQAHTGNGGIGVVVAFVTSEFLVFGGAILGLRRGTLGVNFAVDVARALGSAAITLLLFWWIPPLPFLIGIPVCVFAFFLSSVGLGLVRRTDIQLLWTLLRNEKSASAQ